MNDSSDLCINGQIINSPELMALPKSSPPSVMVQLHWQNRLNIGETEFVAQGEFNCIEQFESWAKEVIERRREECPKNWCPLICWPGSPYFVLPRTEGK